MKKAILLASAALALVATAQVDASKVSNVYESRIQVREVASPAWQIQKHEANLINPMAKQQKTETGRFVSLRKAAQRAATFSANGEKQQLDSIIRYTGKGVTDVPGSKQEFVYTEAGMPQHCFNYVVDAETGAWKLVGEYNYEYDEQGRLIEATSVSNDYGYSFGEKYEYIYGEEGKPYTEQYYYSMGENGEWVPSQRAEYEYDALNHSTLEAFYYTEDGGETWIGQEKKEATYDEQDRMTSYFQYGWDWDNGQWVGSQTFEGQKFYYRADGQDEKIETFAWENGAWLHKCNQLYTYDDNNRLTQVDYNYWNREHQDWLGGDTWGQWGDVEDNQRSVYTYDENGRCPLEMSYSYNRETDQYSAFFKRTREYTELENQRLANEEKVYYLDSNREFYLYNHRSFITNRFGAENYYLNRNYVGPDVPLRKSDETIKDIDDETNRYNSGYFYNFTNDEANTRYGSTYEYCLYDENDNVTHTHHMRGTGQNTDTDWVEYEDFAFEYVYDNQGNPVRYKYDGIVFENGEWIPLSGYELTYDFNAERDNVTIWPIGNKGEYFYAYKTLQEYDYQYYSWNQTMNEVSDVYYYSLNGQPLSGIDDIEVAKPATGKAEYFDLQGRRVSADARGLIIVREADGTTHKVIK